MKKILDGNTNATRTAYFFSEVASIYPITPSSPMASEMDNLSGQDIKNLFNDSVRVVEMQSEAGAAGMMHGSLLSGTLTSTFTASQGLLLMIPNMYKMAGEMLPGVIHVASRTIATHALSIFGDHQDIYATRQTGFCILSSTSVEDAGLLAAVAHLSAIKGSLPFIHFFDGFRTSHEINKVDLIPEEELIKLVDFDCINKFRERALNSNKSITKGTAQNEDIYFQSVEARNTNYLEMPDIVNDYMQKINKIMGTDYKPFTYYGNKDAENIIVCMGSVSATIKEVVDEMSNKGEKVGVITVHLYRPFSVKYLIDVLPKSVKNIAVIDRTKESGSIGEPLYLDILSALKEQNINIVGGRYGLSSRNTTPEDIYSIFMMLKTKLKNNFTIGIIDDVTNLSLEKYPFKLTSSTDELLIYGFGSDGMVSSSKELIKIIGNEKYVQGYFEYDSKKSNGVTISHLRISDNKIDKPYYVTNPKLIIVTKDIYLNNFNVLENIIENGTFILNTNLNLSELDKFLPTNIKKIIKERNVKFHIIDAYSISKKYGIRGKINTIMESIILKLLEVNNYEQIINDKTKERFLTKGEDVVKANLDCIAESLSNLITVDPSLLTIEEENVKKNKNIFEIINSREGYSLKVSDLIPYKTGTFPGGLAKNEKRNLANEVPKWNKEKCVECNLCALLCPHAVLRPFLVDEDNKYSESGKVSTTNNNKKFIMAVSESDCTGCGLCIKNCPVGALTPGEFDEKEQKMSECLFSSDTKNELDKFTIKGSQFETPKFEFSGACGGCGETGYIKLLTQLFKEKLVIANATGCSSIYGASCPSTPYSVSWANSLFEDNAEFGYGLLTGYQKLRNRISNIMLETENLVTDDVKELYNEYLANKNNYEITNKVCQKLMDKDIPNELKSLKDYISAKSVWCIGGDGWAYDIGFGGIDHVLSSNQNIKILVLDTEVYSNTGGQSSKSSRLGQVSEFANMGKKNNKKDLFKMAMNYPNCYVASVSLGANPMQTIKALKEAENHEGPAIIIAYAPCIEHGISGGLINSVSEQKLGVLCGYSLLMRYNPEEDKLYLDSNEPNFEKFKEFIDNEVRYKALKIKDQKLFEDLFEQNKNASIKRYETYKNLSEK